MKTHLKIALVVGALALATAPAAAQAVQPVDPGAQSQGKGPQYEPEKPETPGPGASLPEKAKAYGVYCRTESRKHVEGEKGTPFSQCVTAMAKAAKNERMTARKACKGLSKEHVKGEKGTAFSRCVVAAAQLQKSQKEAAV
jgi:opacity protein-like surface antigen